MEGIKIRSESLAKRCEVCHKSDFFDAKNDFCSRCHIVMRQLYMSPNTKWKSLRWPLLKLFLKVYLIGLVVPLSLFMVFHLSDRRPLWFQIYPSLVVMVIWTITALIAAIMRACMEKTKIGAAL
jgi:hypothetical protein